MSFSRSDTIVFPSKKAFSYLIIAVPPSPTAAHYPWLCQQTVRTSGATAKTSPMHAGGQLKFKRAANTHMVLKLNNVSVCILRHPVSPGLHVAKSKNTSERDRAWARDGTYTNFLIYEMSSEFNLLRNSSDCEYSYTRVCVGRWVSLELHMGSWLLVYALDVLTTWRNPRHQKGYSASFFH